MKRLLVALALSAAVSAAARTVPLVEDNPSRPVDSDPSGLRDLTAGRYELILSGTLCSACLRGVAKELAAEKAVSASQADLENGQVIVTVKAGEKLKASQIRKLLKRAARRVNLGATYQIAAVHYSLTPLEPPTKKK